ncbi:MAG: FtsX-like permease family protein [Sediminibacterium sp.]|nr:FtsX-like permease family protein [Sediminibacterium sp.]
MLRNYCRIAWRNITRNRTNSIINIAGLSIGLACVILITLYVKDERAFDRHLPNAERICQVNLYNLMGGQSNYGSNTPPPVGAALQRTFPEIEAYTRFYVMGRKVISNDANSTVQNHFTEKNFLAVDSNFLQVFNYTLKEGNAASCFEKPNSIVLTESTAKKYFGNSSGIGKSLLVDEYKEPFIVTAILLDIPKQSTIQFDLLIPTSAVRGVKQFSWSWVWQQMNTYVLLNKNFPPTDANLQQLEAKFPDMVRVQAASGFKRIGRPIDEFFKAGNKWDLHLQPLTKVHLYSAAISSPFLTTLGDIKYVYIFSAIALFIIVLACVNFMNLSTAQSATRAKEVGIRKVLGSQRKQLIRQFLTEAMIFSLLSLLAALFLVAALLPLFNTIAGKSLGFSEIFRSGIWLFILVITIITGLLAGSYPAFYLTSFNPVAVLKGGVFKKSLSNVVIRNGLVVFQFTISIAMIICTIIVFQQLRYTRKMDMGLVKDNVIILPNAEKMPAGAAETFRQELSKLPGVSNASISTSIPTQSSFGDSYVPVQSGVKEILSQDLSVSSFMVDESFVPALQLHLLQGRNFSKDFNDSASVIVNQTMVQQAGWKNAVGKYLDYPGNGNQRFQVIGVVKDFNFQSIRNSVSPFALFHASSKTYGTNASFLIVKTDMSHLTGTLQQLESKWKGFAPAVPFEYSFLDKNFEALYESDQRLGEIFSIFTCLSIMVGCLGLFGLSIYTAERRTKEIGIRKVLGASVQNLVGLLSREFIKLVIIAILVAFPIGWWAMTNWLQDFAYQVPISAWVFVLAGLAAMMIALLTVSFQAIKSALANPVRSLRTE